VPAEERRHEVRGAEDVEGARQDGACDSVRHGQDPRDLRLVNGEMGAGRAILALCGKDIVGGLGGELLRCDWSAFLVSPRSKGEVVMEAGGNAPGLHRCSNCRRSEGPLHNELGDH
jgi:hypothetical protein